MMQERVVKIPKGMLAIWIGCVLFFVGAFATAYTDRLDETETGWSEGQVDSFSDRQATFCVTVMTFAAGLLLIVFGVARVSFFKKQDGWTVKYDDGVAPAGEEPHAIKLARQERSVEGEAR